MVTHSELGNEFPFRYRASGSQFSTCVCEYSDLRQIQAIHRKWAEAALGFGASPKFWHRGLSKNKHKICALLCFVVIWCPICQFYPFLGSGHEGVAILLNGFAIKWKQKKVTRQPATLRHNSILYPSELLLWHQDNHIDVLVQERRNSSALAMELRPSCTNTSIWMIHRQWSNPEVYG